jgi:hypothetical protein
MVAGFRISGRENRLTDRNTGRPRSRSLRFAFSACKRESLPLRFSAISFFSRAVSPLRLIFFENSLYTGGAYRMT